MNAYALGLIGSFLLPPKLFLIPAIAFWLLWKRRPRMARVGLGLTLAAMWVFSMPLVADALIETLDRESYQGLAAPLNGVQVIVVLSGGRYYTSREMKGDTVDADSLERARRAAELAKASGLPVLVAGGRPEKNETALADHMSQALKEFGVTARWLETESKTTGQNAEFSARILQPHGVRRIMLVTHGWHMPRAKAAFERAGFTVVPKATGLHHDQTFRAIRLLPTTDGMRGSERFFHECLGLFWYHLTAAGAAG